jgi:hypothetical protein
MIIKKCSHCENNIRIHPVKFPVMNDHGGIIVECEKCNKLSFCETINPVETEISKGGRKIDAWDIDITSKKDAISMYTDIKELTDGLLVVGDLEVRDYEFNFNSPHIYHCSNCGNEIESAAKKALINKNQKIATQYDSLMNYILANHRQQYDNLIVEVDTECGCGHVFVSYWHKNFVADHKPINPEKNLFLIGTDMPINASSIDGIMSKNDCKRILEKFIIRWNAIYPRLLIVTPFVGHQWLSQEEIIELWDWIKNFLDPKKSSLVTRTATYNKYKKACEEKGVSLELLERYGLNNSIVQEFTKKQDFHAKIYVGYSSENTEMLLGSFNLMDGPSVENITFKSTNYDTFKNKFVTPMNIPVVSPDRMELYCLKIYQNEGKWCANRVESIDILNKIMTYE